jgi:hypothetical protein
MLMKNALCAEVVALAGLIRLTREIASCLSATRKLSRTGISEVSYWKSLLVRGRGLPKNLFSPLLANS